MLTTSFCWERQEEGEKLEGVWDGSSSHEEERRWKIGKKKPRERIGCVEQVDDVAFLHVGVVTTNVEK